MTDIAGYFSWKCFGVPFYSSRRCNFPSCKQTGNVIFAQLNYYFPPWLLHRALCFSALSEGLSGSGAKRFVSLRRVVPLQKLPFCSVVYGRKEQTEWFLRQDNLATTIVDNHGKSLLYVSLTIYVAEP